MGKGGGQSIYLGDVYCKWCGKLLPHHSGAGRRATFCNQSHKNSYHTRKRKLASASEDMKLVLEIRQASMAKYTMFVTQPLQALGMDYGCEAMELAWRAITAAVTEATQK